MLSMRIKLIVVIVLIGIVAFSCTKSLDSVSIEKPDTGTTVDSLWTYYSWNYVDSLSLLPSNTISSVCEYANEIWVSTPSDISVFRSNKWRHFQVEGPFFLRTIDGHLVTNHIQVIKSTFLSIFDDYAWSPYYEQNQHLANIVDRGDILSDFIEFKGDRYYAFGFSGVIIDKADKYSHLSSSRIPVFKFKIDSKERLWFLGEWGYFGNRPDTLTSNIEYVENGTLHSLELPAPLKLKDITAVEDWGGIVISSSYWRKIYRFADNSWVDITDKFPSQNVSEFGYDKRGKFWISTFDNGIAKYSDGKWIVYNVYNYLKTNYINTFYFDSHNVLWIPTSSSGLVKYAGEKID